jgi:hypothetical protein
METSDGGDGWVEIKEIDGDEWRCKRLKRWRWRWRCKRLMQMVEGSVKGH